VRWCSSWRWLPLPCSECAVEPARKSSLEPPARFAQNEGRNPRRRVMAKCPACGVNLNDWHILTLGAKNSFRCSHCRVELKAQDKVSGIKVFAGVGFMLGGIAGGLCIAFGHFAQWIAYVLIWFLLLALADVRYTRLDVKTKPAEPRGRE
jgi:hypothetical protein